MELNIWGGFYVGSNAYYLVEGKNNTAENTAAEVIRVIKYDKNWNRLGVAKITGASKFAHEIRWVRLRERTAAQANPIQIPITASRGLFPLQRAARLQWARVLLPRLLR